MAYNWAQLAFVEKWRLQAVRGNIVGMYRPADRTLFDLRLRPGEGNVGAIPTVLDLRLHDAGDIIREKKIILLSKAAVVIRAVGTLSNLAGEASEAGRPRRMLESGSTLSGAVVSADEDTVLLDAGFPVVVQLPEPPAGVSLGQTIRVSLTEPAKGFLVV